MSMTVLAGSVVLAAAGYASLGAGGQTATTQDPGRQAAAPPPVIVEVSPPQPEQQQALSLLRHAVSTLRSPQVVCGMKLWRTDPSIDPAFLKPLPDDAAGAKIRGIPAQECVPGVSSQVRGLVITEPVPAIKVPGLKVPPDKAPDDKAPDDKAPAGKKPAGKVPAGGPVRK